MNYIKSFSINSIIIKTISLIFIMCILLGSLPNCSKRSEKENYEAKKIQESVDTNNKDTDTKSYWSMKYFVDEFGDYTDTSYISGNFEGYFTSKSSILKNDLIVHIYFMMDIGFVSFSLYEYGTNKFSKLSNQKYKLMTKDDDGNIREIDLVYSDGDLVVIDQALLNDIFNCNMLSCIITITNNIREREYHFKITNQGLSELLQD